MKPIWRAERASVLDNSFFAIRQSFEYAEDNSKKAIDSFGGGLVVAKMDVYNAFYSSQHVAVLEALRRIG